MEMNDPFNYPALGRKDLMTLSTINQQRDGQKTTTKKFISGRTVSSNLYTLDIEGAQPKLFGSRALNKPDTQNYNADIDGSMPRQLHMKLEKPEYNLATEDIKGTKPNVMKHVIRTNRTTNPLAPDYVLPVVEPRPPTPPKFLRDSIKIDVRIRSVTLLHRTLMALSLRSNPYTPLENLWTIKILKVPILRNSKYDSHFQTKNHI